MILVFLYFFASFGSNSFSSCDAEICTDLILSSSSKINTDAQYSFNVLSKSTHVIYVFFVLTNCLNVAVAHCDFMDNNMVTTMFENRKIFEGTISYQI